MVQTAADPVGMVGTAAASVERVPVTKRTEALIADIHKKRTGKALAPGIIAMLVELAMSMIKQCLPTQTQSGGLKAFIRAEPIRSRVRLRQGMRQAGILGDPQANEYMETLMRATEEVKEEDFQELAEAETDWTM
jgi:hypothetical protein